MSEAELLDFPEDPRSPLFEASEEEQKEFPAIRRLSGRRVSCIPCRPGPEDALYVERTVHAQCAGIRLYCVFRYIHIRTSSM